MLGFKILIVVAVLAVNFASSEVSDGNYYQSAKYVNNSNICRYALIEIILTDLLRELKGSDVVLCASDAFVNQDSECDEACQKLDKKLSGFCNYKIKQCKCTITGR